VLNEEMLSVWVWVFEMIYWFNFMGTLCLELHCWSQRRKIRDEMKRSKGEGEGEREREHRVLLDIMG